MTMVRHVPYLLAIAFGSMIAIFAHACAPRGASWWTVALFVAACAVLAGSLAMRLYRWLLNDSPSPITRRDVSCWCGRHRARGVVAMNDDDALRIKQHLCVLCDYCGRHQRPHCGLGDSQNSFGNFVPEMDTPISLLRERCVIDAPEPRASARADVNPSAVFEGVPS